MRKNYLLSTTVTYSPPAETTAAGEALEPATQSPARPPETRQPLSSVSRRGRPQAPRAPPQHRSGAYSVAQFCEAYGVSVGFLYKLWAKGEGPDVMKWHPYAHHFRGRRQMEPPARTHHQAVSEESLNEIPQISAAGIWGFFVLKAAMQ